MNQWRRLRNLFAREDAAPANGGAAADADADETDGEEAEDSVMLPQSRAQKGSASPLSPISRASSRYSGGAPRKLKHGTTKAKDTVTSRTRLNSNQMESSEEESSTARLSRRSSVLVDLFALFRRSSSYGQQSRHATQRFRDNDDLDESDEEDNSYQEMSKEKLLEAIRQKKEIIEKVRLQAWNMRRKRRTLKVAQRHLQRQKAQVSKVHLYNVEFQRRAKAILRWLGNASKYLIPWESKIKRIESHFGSVVSSYFIFLRWVLSVNITTSMILLFFVVIPEWLADMQADQERFNRTHHIKVMPAKVREHTDELNTVLDFGGYLQYSYLFYGYYSSETFFGNFIQYNVPIAYFCVNLFILAFCLFIILKKMTSNTRRSKLSSGKQDQYVFTWKVITGWDYNIGNAETSGSLFHANVIKLREATADYNKKIKQKWTWMIFVMRLLVNTVIISMFALSVYAIYRVAQITEKDTFLKQNAVSITVVVTTILFPPIFELVLRLERYRPRTALRTHLFRVLFFYLINYFTLIYSLFKMLNNLEMEMRVNEISNRLSQQQSESFHIVHNPYTYNQSYYEVITSRSSRQLDAASLINETILSALPSPPTTVVYYTNVPTTTTIEPLRPWTTVFPNYGPFGVGVYNPKAIVVSSDKRVAQGVHKTVYESRAIGPIADWSPQSAKATQGPVTLNYTSSPRNYYQLYRASNYDDLCWETLIGQEITKIVTTDLVLTIFAILIIDFLRDVWIRYCGSWWCWDIEGTFPEYAEFKVAENVLHLVNNQGMIWLGTILVPMLPMINNLNLIILMYIRAWACMTCNVPARQIFRASRSSNFYFWILLLMLCMSTLPVGFVIASKKPSKNCGPFGGQERFYSVISEVLHNNLNKNIVDVIQYIMSPGIVIPILLLMLLIIYFLVLLVSGLKAANTDLSKQLTHERTEEKKKIFELAGGGRKRPSQFTFHRPSDFNVRQHESSSSPRSRSMRGFSDSPPRRRMDGSGGSAERRGDENGNASGSGGGSGGGGSGGSARFNWRNSSGKRLPTRTESARETTKRGSPEEKMREGTYRKRGAGIRRTVTGASASALSIGDNLVQPYSLSDDQLHSPTKSSLIQSRFPSFLPSLQSVNENDNDEEESTDKGGAIDAKNGARKMSQTERLLNEERRRSAVSAVSTQQSVVSRVSIDQTPVRLNWHQKLMVWIGLGDPQKLELKERLRRQIARNKAAEEQRRIEETDAEAAKSELIAVDTPPTPRTPSSDLEEGKDSRLERRPLKSSLRKSKRQQKSLFQPALLPSQAPTLPTVESASNESSGSTTNGTKRPTPRRGTSKTETQSLMADDKQITHRTSPMILEEAEYSLASEEDAERVVAEVDYAAEDEEMNDDEEQEVEEISVVSSTTATVSAGKSLSDSHPQPNTPAGKSASKWKAGFPLTQSQSESERLKFHREAPDSDNVISEASPVVGRRRDDVFPTTHDSNKLLSEKRSPRVPFKHPPSTLKNGACAKSRNEDMPPSPPRHYNKRDVNSTRRRSPLKKAASEAAYRRTTPIAVVALPPSLKNDDNGSNNNGVSSGGNGDALMQLSNDPTCVPSDDNSFRDPTPPPASSSAGSLMLHRRGSHEIGVDEIGEPSMCDSFRYAEDPRLSYANPYSSYAAAMCSPLELSERRNNEMVDSSDSRRSSYGRFQREQQRAEQKQQQDRGKHPLYQQQLQQLQRIPYEHLLPYQSLQQQQQQPYQQSPYQTLFYDNKGKVPGAEMPYYTLDNRWPSPYAGAPSMLPPPSMNYRLPPYQYQQMPTGGFLSPSMESGYPQYMYDVLPYQQQQQQSQSYTAPQEQYPMTTFNQQQSHHRLKQLHQQQLRQELQGGAQSLPYQDSPISMRGQKSSLQGRETEEGSTSGRGTMPPDYFTESPSGSSPEFGKPKYRIAMSPLTGHRSDQGGYSSDTSGVRRFAIRQRSAVGGGSPPGSSSSPSPPKALAAPPLFASLPRTPAAQPTSHLLPPDQSHQGICSQQTTV